MILLLRLIRLPNLLVVALTQSLIFYRLIVPALQRAGLATTLSHVDFALLVTACLAVTAAGYVVNDLLDAPGDDINRPGQSIVYALGLDFCRWLFLGLVLGGYFISLLLAMSLDQGGLLWLYPLSIGLLTLYSRFIKPVPFAGNLLVALFCAGVPALVALAERSGLRAIRVSEPAVLQVIAIYCLFAFLATLYRELVKDLEDMKGDRAIGRRTLPLVLGEGPSRWLAALLAILTLGALAFPVLAGWPLFSRPLMLVYLGVLAIALLFLVYQTLASRQSADYGRLSLWLKFFFLTGLGLLVFI